MSKYLPPLNVQHIPSSVGKKVKYCIHGSESPNQLQSKTRSVQDGAVCFQNTVFKFRVTFTNSILLSYSFQDLEQIKSSDVKRLVI